MKTEIIQKYIPREGYFIDKVLPLTENKTAVFTSQYNEPSFLDILGLGEIENSINLSKITGIDPINNNQCYFNLGNKIGLMRLTKEIFLFNPNKLDDYEIVKISNPIKGEMYYKHTYAELASNFLIDNKLLFGIASFKHNGYPPRYLAQLEIAKSKPLFPLGREGIKVTWGPLFELPKEKFPETEFDKFKCDSDWLNIRDLVQINDIILVHSTGGSSTRLKSGNPFEFNIIAKFDKNYNWLENKEIHKGIGQFSTDKLHFIQNPKSHKNKLLFYTTDKIEIDFEISLTAKQNLGKEKPTSIRGDKLGDNIFIYNHRFLNVCRQAD